ncbi:MAG: hypothetical protein UY07_C0030G0005 [Parcubacteria group bacterium GW2011_GWA1_47_8]|nr:MAG: hypothetical protein UW71_C0034G0003 [Parcubacteria group bacterium GW2011_GWB1_44_7]KKU80893.1 MAG: hypothetical protein UY07_C0030G0005 [Parcubacteria group bacterium GW2011_GWA1_47_8]
MKKSGFTLTEILVVVAIIGILSSIALASFGIVREKAKIAKAKSELRSARSGIALLESDTGKWPNGCPPSQSSNPEVNLEDAQAGVTSRPVEGVVDSPCEWTADEVNRWNGPYMKVPTDPWGTSYVFDPDYHPGENRPIPPNTNCPGYISSNIIAVVSYGPNKLGLNAYDCDDVYLEMR